MLAEPTALPGDDGTGLDEDQNISPAGPGPGQPGPEQPIGHCGADSRRKSLIDGELVTQRKNLELEGNPRSERCAEQGQDSEEDFLHDRGTVRNPGGVSSVRGAENALYGNTNGLGHFDVSGTHSISPWFTRWALTTMRLAASGPSGPPQPLGRPLCSCLGEDRLSCAGHGLHARPAGRQCGPARPALRCMSRSAWCR